MKHVVVIWLSVAFAFLFSGCGILFTGAKKDLIGQIEKNMSQKEVLSLLGEPDYKRFAGEMEQWEYRDYYYVDQMPVNVIIDFSGKEVVALNTYDTSGYPVSPGIVFVPSNDHGIPEEQYPGNEYISVMTKREFEHFYQRMKEVIFYEKQLDMLEDKVRDYNFTCKQAKQLLDLTTISDKKIAILNILAPVLADRENDEILVKAMRFRSDREKAKIILDEYKN